MKLNRRIDWFVIVTSIVCAVSCSGGGCGGCTTFSPIPGGFAPAKRNANAVQVRVTPTALSFITSNPAKIIGGLVGGNTSNGVIQFPVPASNCASDNPALCCDSNNNTVSPCGPIDIDLNQHAGDPAVLVLTPQSGQSRLDLTINTRVQTAMDVPLNYDTGIFGTLHCGLHVDSTQGSTKYFTISAQINFVQDATAGTTRINATNVAVNNVDGSDISLTGGAACSGASFLLSFAPSFITGQIATQLQNTINNATCKKCSSGDVAECGSTFATACTGGTCMEGSACLEDLGIDGRAKGVALFGGFSPGTSGALDLYEVAGGYATSDGGGLSLGLLGGMEPAGAPRDMCGPPASEPAKVAIPVSSVFQNNTLPGTSTTFDVGIGLHQSQLDQFAYAGYDGGLLCLTVGHGTVSQLTTDTLSLLSRSLGKLVQSNSPMAVGIRPQSPPTIALGPNTYTSDGMGGMTLDQPLLDIHFKALEIDFFAEVDQQWIRAFTVVSDVHLPVGLETGAPGKLTPVIGNPSDAFTNISVKNSDAVTETPDQLAGLFPSLLGLVLPQLSSGLSPISLPAIGGLNLDITSVTSVDNNTFMAIFANLKPAMRPAPVHTFVDVENVAEPDPGIAKDAKRWAAATPPRVTLSLGADASDVEYSIRLDDGAWSAWSTNARPTLSPATFWLPGIHHAEVRARRIGHPETIDLTPPRIAIPLGMAALPPKPATKLGQGGADFHGSAGATGCGCDAHGNGAAGGGALLVLAILFVIAPVRRIRASIKRVGVTVWLVAIACLPGCDCGSAPCGSAACMKGEVAHAPGKWTSIAGDDQRVLVATYDVQNGDLVVADATNASKLKYTVVDGIPEGVTPTYDPSTYRGGVADPGPDVGAWTSIALGNHSARVAYQDRDALALKYAYEDGDHHWHSYVVDDGSGHAAGEYANLVIDGDGKPAIAYLVIGVDDGMGHRVTNLQLARAGKTAPSAESDWTITTIASAPGTCAGLCNGGDVCVPGTPQTCATPDSSCTGGCGSAQACVAGACVTPIVDPMIDDVPTGTGMWVSLVVMSDGRLGATYYDQTRRALIFSIESAKGSNQFTENILDGNVVDADRGMWCSAVVANDDTVHIAYQDALGDQLMYTTWNGQAGTPEVVDDGERPGDRTHPVGAGNAIYLVNGTPAIAYQDGMTADVYVATRGAGTWSTTPLAMGPTLDGFSIGATTAHGGNAVLAWDLRDPSLEDNGPPNALAVIAP